MLSATTSDDGRRVFEVRWELQVLRGESGAELELGVASCGEHALEVPASPPCAPSPFPLPSRRLNLTVGLRAAHLCVWRTATTPLAIHRGGDAPMVENKELDA